MRLLLLLTCVGVTACAAPAAACRPGSCPTGEHCVFTTPSGDPRCTPACALDGGCATGTCTCRPYSTATQDCVQVCQEVR